jgi:tetratricopeptide (TPR) repeat protein
MHDFDVSRHSIFKLFWPGASGPRRPWCRIFAGLFLSAVLAVTLSGCVISGTQDLTTARKQTFPFDTGELNSYVNESAILALRQTDKGYWLMDWTRPDNMRQVWPINFFEVPGYDGWLVQAHPPGADKNRFVYQYVRKLKNELRLYTVSENGVYQINRFPSLKQRLTVDQGKMGSAAVADVAISSQASPGEAFDSLQQMISLKIDLVNGMTYRAADLVIAEAASDPQRDPKEKYRLRGLAYMAKGNPDRAIADFSAAITGPDDLRIYYLRAVAYQRKGDPDGAVADFTSVVTQTDPSSDMYYDALYGRGMAYHDKGDFDRAIADFSDVIEHSENANDAHYRRGLAYESKGNVDRAVVDYGASISLAGKSDAAAAVKEFYANVHHRRGNLYLRRGEHGQAVADFTEALRLVPGHPGLLADLRRAQDAMAPRQPQGVTVSERRVALVIGNSAYRSVAFLPNPRRDAQSVADALRQTGFQTVEVAMDLDRDAMVKALRAFRTKADEADWALIYFAGHGIEIDRVNYLIPTDASLIDDRDVKSETVSYEEVLSAISNARALRMLILDACRVNPFKERMRRSALSRDVTVRGLAPPPESAPGTLIVYSAKEGDVAADDAGGVNSPFARAFVDQLKVPGREVRRLFDYVRDEVMDATGKRQQPFTYGSLPGKRDFYFVAGR